MSNTNWAIETLDVERDALNEKINLEKALLKSSAIKGETDLKEAERHVSDIDVALKILNLKLRNKNEHFSSRKGCKRLAYCENQSLVYCRTKCQYRFDKSCDLIPRRGPKEKKSGSAKVCDELLSNR